MAVRQATVSYVSGRIVKIEWTGLLNGDSGAPVKWGDFADRSAHIHGTFGVGGSLTVEGGNNGTSYVALTDPQGNAITKTGEAVEQVVESTLEVRPRVTAGDGTTNLTCTIIARKPY